ncbi:xylose isomerase [Vibrio astriarenae]|nr:xylose isomerase [Vibrio sp. C7]
MALSLKRAAEMIENDVLSQNIAQRYADWNGDLGKKILSGDLSLEEVAKYAVDNSISPSKVSGRQEHLENIVNGFIFK